MRYIQSKFEHLCFSYEVDYRNTPCICSWSDPSFNFFLFVAQESKTLIDPVMGIWGKCDDIFKCPLKAILSELTHQISPGIFYNFMKIKKPLKNEGPWSDLKMFNAMKSQGCLSQTFPFLSFHGHRVSLAEDQAVVLQRSLGSSRSRKVSLISSLCDGVSSQDPDFAIVPLPEPDWRMTALSRWRKWGGQGRAQGHIWVSPKTMFSPTYQLRERPIFHVPAAPWGWLCWPVWEKSS